MKNLKNEKSCVSDMMFNETYKYNIDLLLQSLHYLFNNIGNIETFSSILNSRL